MRATAVVGAQFGSEGKGLIVSHIAEEHSHHVRVGAANAGHTVYTQKRLPPECDSGGDLPWEKHVMQQLPCATYCNTDADLYVGPGALISPEIFGRELQRMATWRAARGMDLPNVWVDRRAHVITDAQIDREGESGLAERIGSTSTIAREGIGIAQADRVMREPWCLTAEKLDASDFPEWDLIQLCDVPERLHAIGSSVLLEGTQGTGLSLTTGRFPYVTSRNTTAAGLAADSGVSPRAIKDVIIVARTYPIRVAGPSGPFGLGSKEIAWEDIGVDRENERTTVTKLVRRVATLSFHQIREAAWLNGATQIALTFCDYLDPQIAGKTGNVRLAELQCDHPLVHDLVVDIEQVTRVPVTMLGTGPHHVIDVR